MMKRIICTLAAVAMVIATHTSAQAINKGELARNKVVEVAVDNTNRDPTTVTVYFIDNRGIDVVEMVTVPAGELNFIITLPRLGRATKRVVIELDNGNADGRFTVRVEQFQRTSTEEQIRGDGRLVFDVVPF